MTAVSRARAPSSHSPQTPASFSPRSHSSSDCSRVRPPASSRRTTPASSSRACSYESDSRSVTLEILFLIGGHGELVFREPDYQVLTRRDVRYRADNGALGVLHDGVAAAQRCGGGQREQPRPGVRDVVAGPGQARVEGLAGPPGEGLDLLRLALDLADGVGERGPGAHAVQPGPLAVEPAGHGPPGPVPQLGD